MEYIICYCRFSLARIIHLIWSVNTYIHTTDKDRSANKPSIDNVTIQNVLGW